MPCTVSINLDSLDPAWQYGNPLNDSFSKHVTNPFSTFHIHLSRFGALVHARLRDPPPRASGATLLEAWKKGCRV